MKKIITILLLSTLSLGVLSQGTFNMTIPQPDFVSNDWDGDNIPNNEDNDIDNDGIPNDEDGDAYSNIGQSSYVPPDCQGYYPGEWDDNDNHKYLSEVQLPSGGGIEYGLVWREGGVQEGWLLTNGNTIEPVDRATGYEVSGYIYWLDPSKEVVGTISNFTPMGPYNYTYYKTCRVEA